MDESRKKSWARSKEFYPNVRDAKPNKAHIAIAELEKLEKLECVITQNIDNLHQKAGNTRVIEVHGTACDYYADIIIHRKAGEIMEKIVEEVKRTLGGE